MENAVTFRKGTSIYTEDIERVSLRKQGLGRTDY